MMRSRNSNNVNACDATSRVVSRRGVLVGGVVLVMSACAAPPVVVPTPSAQPTAVPATEAPTAVATAVLQPTPAPVVTATASMAKLKVVATFSVLGDFVRVVASDSVTLKTLVGPDGDTHEFEPAPSDIVSLADADVIVENGLAFEGWLDNLYRASGSKAVRVVASDGLTPREMTENGKTETDPHVWQNPLNAIEMVKTITVGLSKADVANADAYAKNAAAYIKQLQGLDAELSAEIDKVSRDQRKIVTSHDALGYFAERYGFEIIGSVIQALSTEAGEPSAQDLVTLVDNIQAAGAKAIFLESMGNPTLVERVAAEAGVEIGPALYTDALGEPGSPGATYIEAMRHNAQAIVATLR